MVDQKIIHVLIDTSLLREAGDGFRHPSFRKLLEYSKKGELKIYVPHIAWEERRTQILLNATDNANKLRVAYEKVKDSSSIVFSELPVPTLSLFDDEQIGQASKDAMKKFAEENNIEVLPLERDHAARAWHRYFEVLPPFNPLEPDREKRRKDIPDSWIFESAIDIKAKHPDLIALIRDGKLTAALNGIHVEVYETFDSVVDLIESLKASSEDPTLEPAQVDTLEINQPLGRVDLRSIINQAQDQFELVDTKVLGFVFYAEPIAKAQLIELLNKAGVSEDVSQNAIDRLVISNLIADTGNNYILKNKQAGEIAGKSMEAEIIGLMNG